MHLDDSDRFKFIRKVAGNLTQKQLCDSIDIPEHRVKSIESGKTKISTDIALALEEKFNFSFKWILTGKGDMYTQEIVSKKVGNGSESPISLRNSIVTEHAKLVERFEDSEAEKEINENLIFIEQIDKDSFYELRGYIKGIANGLKTITKTSKQKGRSGGKKVRKVV